MLGSIVTAPAGSSPRDSTRQRNYRTWTVQETELLKQLVASHGTKANWVSIASMLPGRSSKQCRDRWVNIEAEGITTEKWSNQEDLCIAAHHASNGTKWALLSKKLPGRSQLAIKNHWHSTCRSKSTTNRDSLILYAYIQEIKSGRTPGEAYAKILADHLHLNIDAHSAVQPAEVALNLEHSGGELLSGTSSSHEASSCPSPPLSPQEGLSPSSQEGPCTSPREGPSPSTNTDDDDHQADSPAVHQLPFQSNLQSTRPTPHTVNVPTAVNNPIPPHAPPLPPPHHQQAIPQPHPAANRPPKRTLLAPPGPSPLQPSTTPSPAPHPDTPSKRRKPTLPLAPTNPTPNLNPFSFSTCNPHPTPASQPLNPPTLPPAAHPPHPYPAPSLTSSMLHQKATILASLAELHFQAAADLDALHTHPPSSTPSPPPIPSAADPSALPPFKTLFNLTVSPCSLLQAASSFASASMFNLHHPPTQDPSPLLPLFPPTLATPFPHHSTPSTISITPSTSSSLPTSQTTTTTSSPSASLPNSLGSFNTPPQLLEVPTSLPRTQHPAPASASISSTQPHQLPAGLPQQLQLQSLEQHCQLLTSLRLHQHMHNFQHTTGLITARPLHPAASASAAAIQQQQQQLQLQLHHFHMLTQAQAQAQAQTEAHAQAGAEAQTLASHVMLAQYAAEASADAIVLECGKAGSDSDADDDGFDSDSVSEDGLVPPGISPLPSDAGEQPVHTQQQQQQQLRRPGSNSWGPGAAQCGNSLAGGAGAAAVQDGGSAAVVEFCTMCSELP